MTQVANKPMPTTVKSLCDSPQSEDTRKMRNSLTHGFGYGDEPEVPRTLDLGYDEEVPADSIPADAAPIRAVKRKSQRNNFSIYGDINIGADLEAQAAAWTDSDDSDYSESSEYSEDMEDPDDDDESYLSGEDPADFVHASLQHQGSFHNKRTSAARTPSYVSVECDKQANPNMPSRVDLQFGTEDPDTPRRISLQFDQTMSNSDRSIGSSSSSRRGRLDVSLGTSSLPRRCVSAGSTRVTLSRGTSYTAERRSCSDIANVPRQQQTIRRTTMDVAGSRPVVRRISRDTPARRTTLDHTAPCPPPRRVSRNPSITPARRMTMEHCTDDSDDAPPPTTRPSLNRSSRIIAGAPNSQAGRRLTIDLKSSVPMAGAAALKPKRSTWAAKRRSTLDHNVAPPSRRSTSAARNSTLVATRRTTLDHSLPCPPPRRVSRNPSIQHARRTTMDHCTDQSPKSDEAPPARRSLGRSTMVMAGAPESKTGRRLTMDLKSSRSNPAAMSSAVLRRVTMSTATATSSERNCSSHSPVRRLPRRTFSGRAA